MELLDTDGLKTKQDLEKLEICIGEMSPQIVRALFKKALNLPPRSSSRSAQVIRGTFRKKMELLDTGISRKRTKNFSEPNGKMTDVCLVVDGKKFYVSKVMLAEHSPVFEAMFFGGFVEAESKEVVIEDTDADSFKVFLSLIYSADTNFTNENVEEVFKLADRYDVSCAIEKCEELLISNNDVEMAKKLILSEKYSLATVQKKCLDGLKTKEDLEKLEICIGEMSPQIVRALFKKALNLSPRSSSRSAQVIRGTFRKKMELLDTGISRKRTKNFSEPNGKMTDVCLVVDGKKFYVSKVMLAEHSPIFEAMFFGRFVEAESKEVVIEDTDADSFKVFLSLIYSAHTNISNENVEQVLKLADRYDVSCVYEKCEEFLISNIDVEIAKKLKLSEKYSLATLQDKCLDGLKTKEDLEKLQICIGEMSPQIVRALFKKALNLSSSQF